MSDSPRELFDMQVAARKALHHAAHVYAKTKNPEHREAAAEALDRAALTMAFATAQWGLVSDCAAPAGTVGEAWKERIRDDLFSAPESQVKKGRR